MTQVLTISAEQRQAIAQMVVAPDGADFVLGRPDLNRYVCVPAAGAEFVRQLQAEGSLAQATARAGEVAGEPVDGAEFWAGLAEAGLLDAPSKTSSSGYRISPRLARRFFGRAGWSVYLTFAALAISILAARPDLRPTFESAWFLADPILSLLLILPVGLALSGVHEWWHWLAGRAEGITGSFRVSFRGPYLVFETDLTQIVALPRRRRYGPFLAGMAMDSSLLGLALLARLAFRLGWITLPAVTDRLLGAIVLILVLAIVWQWAGLFLRNDGYAVLANFLRCHNLYRATFLTNKWRLRHLTEAEQAELAAISERDRSTALWFGVVQLIGMGLVAWMMLNFALPLVIGTAAWVFANLRSPDLTAGVFWKSVLALLYLAAVYFGPLLLAVRQRLRTRIGVPS